MRVAVFVEDVLDDEQVYGLLAVSRYFDECIVVYSLNVDKRVIDRVSSILSGFCMRTRVVNGYEPFVKCILDLIRLGDDGILYDLTFVRRSTIFLTATYLVSRSLPHVVLRMGDLVVNLDGLKFALYNRGVCSRLFRELCRGSLKRREALESLGISTASFYRCVHRLEGMRLALYGITGLRLTGPGRKLCSLLS